MVPGSGSQPSISPTVVTRPIVLSEKGIENGAPDAMRLSSSKTFIPQQLGLSDHRESGLIQTDRDVHTSPVRNHREPKRNEDMSPPGKLHRRPS